jgi:hypothetical protein
MKGRTVHPADQACCDACVEKLERARGLVLDDDERRARNLWRRIFR